VTSFLETINVGISVTISASKFATDFITSTVVNPTRSLTETFTSLEIFSITLP
jgi:hypothetical protein